MGSRLLNARSSHARTVCMLGAILLFTALPARGQSIEIWNMPCQKLLKSYKTKPAHKAFAVSYLSSGSGGGQSCGAAWGASSKKAAEGAAIKQCKSNVAGSCGINRSE